MGSHKKWSDPSILKAIPNPSRKAYEIKIKNEEFSSEGVKCQPDTATIYITFYPARKVIELRSFKEYLYQFRHKLISYERVINVIYDDLMSVYRPQRLRLVMVFGVRGGSASRLTIDSDWRVRGGKERFRDWIGQSDEWIS